jgi:hypothetical protein
MPSNNPFDELNERLDRVEKLLLRPSPGQSSIEIINRKELQGRLNISEASVIDWGRRGWIPEIRMGSSIRYNWPEVVRALEERSKTEKRQHKKILN